MIVKITANGNALTLGSDTIVAANNEAYTELSDAQIEVSSSTGKIINMHLKHGNNSHNIIGVGSTSGTVHRLQVGNLTNDGNFHTVLDSL